MTALSPAKTLPAPGALLLVPVDAIDAGTNVRTRFGKDGLQALADSLKANGQAEPLLLRPSKKPGRYELIAGARRLLAAKRAGLTHVHAIAGECDDARRVRLQLAENLDREDLDTADVARLVKDLHASEGSVTAVAALVKRSPAWVSKHLAAASRYNWRTKRLLETGKCEDLELLGALNQLENLASDYPPGLDHKTFEDASRRVEKGKATRDELRKLVADAKAAQKAKNDAAREREKKRKTKTAAPAKTREPAAPKPLTPDDLASELLECATEGSADDLKAEFAKHDPHAIAAAEALLRTAWEEGVHLREAGTPAQRLFLVMFSDRWQNEANARAAGYAGVPFSLEAICQAINEAAKMEDDLRCNAGRARD